MSTFNAIATIKSRAEANGFKTDSGAVLKQIARGGEFLQKMVDSILTKEACSALMTNQKAVKRFLQACNFALSGNSADFEKHYAYVFATIALSKTDTITFSNMHHLLGINKENAQAIAGVSRQRLARFIGSGSTAGTIKTKVTHAVGKSGIFTALGVTSKGDAHGFTLTAIAKTHPLVIAYAYQLERMTEGQFILLTQDKK